MSSKGVLRNIDDLGRITIPKEYRKTLNIRDNELIDISINENKIVLQKNTNITDISEVLDQYLYNFYSPEYYKNNVEKKTSMHCIR